MRRMLATAAGVAAIGAATAIRQRLLDLREQGVAILVISEELEELFESSP